MALAKVAVALVSVLATFWLSGWATAEEALQCKPIEGAWRMTFSGQSCAGEQESGTFTLVVSDDCSFSMRKDTLVPFLGSNAFSARSIDVEDTAVRIIADIAFDDCRNVTPKGSTEDVDGDKHFVEEYRYEVRGGGDFQGMRTRPEK
jgi:hypothetical protein